MHHQVAVLAVKHRHTLGVNQLAQAIRIHWGLRRWRTRQHPQALHNFVNVTQCLPAGCLCVLVGRGFINHNEVEPTIDDLVLHNIHAIKVDDDKLSTGVDDFLALVSAPVGYRYRAMDSKFK